MTLVPIWEARLLPTVCVKIKVATQCIANLISWIQTMHYALCEDLCLQTLRTRPPCPSLPWLVFVYVRKMNIYVSRNSWCFVLFFFSGIFIPIVRSIHCAATGKVKMSASQNKTLIMFTGTSTIITIVNELSISIILQFIPKYDKTQLWTSQNSLLLLYDFRCSGTPKFNFHTQFSDHVLSSIWMRVKLANLPFLFVLQMNSPPCYALGGLMKTMKKQRKPESPFISTQITKAKHKTC